MSAKSKQQAEEKGQRSGKGNELLSRLVDAVTGSDSDEE